MATARRTVAIIVNFVVRRAVGIVIDIVVRRAVAIVVNVDDGDTAVAAIGVIRKEHGQSLSREGQGGRRQVP